MGGKSSQNSQGGVRVGDSRKSKRVVVDYKGLNTVMQTSQKNLIDGSGTNKSRVSNHVSQVIQNPRFNNVNNNTIKQTVQYDEYEEEYAGFNNGDADAGDNQFIYDEEKEIDRQNEESFANDESLMNQSIYNNMNAQPLTNQYAHGGAAG